MIPRDYITAWRKSAPWVQDIQVEQDLVICRALVAIFAHPLLSKALAFRGGTALYKLFLKPAARYSEDIDLVQARAEPIGATVDAIRDALAWLGTCHREQAGHSMHLVNKYTPEADALASMKLKVEINTREHDSLLGLKLNPFAVEKRLV